MVHSRSNEVHFHPFLPLTILDALRPVRLVRALEGAAMSTPPSARSLLPSCRHPCARPLPSGREHLAGVHQVEDFESKANTKCCACLPRIVDYINVRVSHPPAGDPRHLHLGLEVAGKAIQCFPKVNQSKKAA